MEELEKSDEIGNVEGIEDYEQEEFDKASMKPGWKELTYKQALALWK